MKYKLDKEKEVALIHCEECEKFVKEIQINELSSERVYCNETCEQTHLKRVEFIKDFNPFIDKYGLVTPDGKPCGNGIRYTAECVVAAFDNKVLDSTMKMGIFDCITDCQLSPGLFKRHPEHTDQEGPDDYIGLGTISHFLGYKNIARSILKYGRTHKYFGVLKYVYNNVDPNKFSMSAWLGRMPQLICHLQFAAGEDPSLFKKIWWCGSVLNSLRVPSTDQDAFALTWHLVRVAEGKSKLCDFIINIWRKRQKHNISEILSDYFNNQFHPLVKWLKNS